MHPQVSKALGLLILCTAGCSTGGNENSQQEQGATERAPQQNGTQTAAADSDVGVSSEGTTYPVQVSASDADGAEAGASEGTGEQSREIASEADMRSLLALQPLTGGLGQEIIIGNDDRTRIANTTTYPERAMVLIALPGGRCSGALVGPNLVITAGHCVHSGGPGGNWMSSATIYPGRNGTASPYGACRARNFYSVLGWTRDKNPAYDFGAIKLDCEVGTRTGWLGFFWRSASLIGMQARISSYPGDKPLEQWTHTDSIRSETSLQTFYNTDTMPGNSGSGVFATNGVPAGCNGPCIHTVHAYGLTNRNGGTRITQPLFNNLVRWKAE